MGDLEALFDLLMDKGFIFHKGALGGDADGLVPFHKKIYNIFIKV
jgi:hypothetical protein